MEQIYIARKINYKKAILFFLGGGFFIVAGITTAILIYGPQGVLGDPNRNHGHGAGLGRAMVAPLVFIILGLLLAGYIPGTIRSVVLRGSMLRLGIGPLKKLSSLPNIDLNKVVDVRTYTYSVGAKHTVLVLKDDVGRELRLDLTGFRAAKIMWLRDPLLAVLQKPTITKDAATQQLIAQWFNMPVES